MESHRAFRYSRDTLLRTALAPASPSVSYSLATRGASDQTLRGGDLFDAYVRPDGSVAILIADASSKGALSIVHTELMRRAFRMAAITERSPAAMMGLLNQLRFDGPPPFGNVTFAAALIVTIERCSEICRYASAGHDIGLFFRGRAHRHLRPTGPVLGVFGSAVYTDCIEPFCRDDFLLLATDGFTECRDAFDDGRQFGTAGLARAVATEPPRTCAAAASAVARRADEFSGGRYRDDATLAVIARNDDGGAGA